MSKNLYSINSHTKIHEIGGLMGPISTPIELSNGAVLSMLDRGIEIYKHNPHNLGEMVLVTRDNINSITFGNMIKSTSQKIVDDEKAEFSKPVEVITKDNSGKNSKPVTKPDSFSK